MLRGDEGADVLAVQREEVAGLRLRPGVQFGEVAAVSVDRVGRHATLDHEVVEVVLHVGRGQVRSYEGGSKRCSAIANDSPIIRRNRVPMPG